MTPKNQIKDIVMRSVASLKAHPKNSNRHTPEQIKRLAEIIEFQGWRYPIKVSTSSGFITSGHGRLEAAKLRGWTEVPVSFQDYDSEEQEFADVVSDNAIAEWAELDLSFINTQIPDLGPNFDIDLLGIKDFVIEPLEKIAMDEILRDDMNKKFMIEVIFPNDMEMMDIHDDLVSRGYIVKIKK